MSLFRFLGSAVAWVFSLTLMAMQTVFMALGQVWANKIRACLTALGIIIGVGSVIAVVGGLTGMERYVLSEFETFGAKKMWVWGSVPDEMEDKLNWTDVKVTVSEGQHLVEHSDAIEMFTPMAGLGGTATYGEKVVPGVSARGIWPEWHEIEDRQLLIGRPFSRIDEDESRQVCLINEKGIEELGLPIDPVGEYIFFDGRRFLIVGLVETKEVGPMFGANEAQTELYIPFSTSKKLNPYSWTYFMMQITDPEMSQDALVEAKFIMRQLRGLDPETPDTFGVEVLQNAINQFQSVAGVIGMIALVVVAISLLVGGIGIMNIMLVSVSERTREIGLRKAVGAPPLVVLLQFLIEAVMLCLVGGLIGVGIGQALVLGLKHMPGMPLEHASVPMWAVILALSSSALVGIVAGMFPAIKAAMLNPISALRHE